MALNEYMLLLAVDFLSVIKLVNGCLEKMFLCAIGLSNDGQTTDQPDVAGGDVKWR